MTLTRRAGAWLLFAWLALASLPAAAQELAPIPPLSARVTDTTGTLDTAQRDALERRLAALEQDKGSQVAILIVPTTQPEAIEQYGIRVAEAWKIGRKGIDDGVILLVAKEDRRLRIEVGRGLEGAIPDAIAKRIIAEIISPRFKQGDFAGGLSAGVEAIAARIAGEPLPAPEPSRRDTAADPTDWLVVLLIGTVVVGSMLRALLGRVLGAGSTSALVGGATWLLTASLVIGLVAAGLAFLFVLAQSGGGRRGYGGGMGVPWGGGGGGWSGGGDSWSGGGGDFGGGGASGDW